MPNYKLAVSKEGSKYSIIFKADNEIAARSRVHKEWYSILGIEEILDNHEIWNTFVFEWYKNWEFKHWKIVWNDIFKSYVKLRRNLEYDVKLIYSEDDKNISQEKKDNIIRELKEEYELFYKDSKRDRVDELREKNQSKNKKEENNKLENFYLKKELWEVTNLLEIVLKKLESIILWTYLPDINNETKFKLREIFNEIIKLKKSTNISKLREIWELALLKIWKLELQELEKTKNIENRNLLKQTNKLLKKLWSKDQFIEKDRDIVYQLNNLLNNINTKIKNSKKEKKETFIDKESHSYIKNRLYLVKYKERLRENTIFIIKNFYKFFYDIELREETFLRRVVIKQNIILFKARDKWIWFSYTFVKKWIKTILNWVMNFISNVKNYIFYVILFYLLIFLFFINYSSFFNLNSYNYDWMFYFIIILFLYVILSISKNIIILMINFVFLFFIIIFGVINF